MIDVAEMLGPESYRFTRANNPKRTELKGRLCRVLARGKLSSALVDFEGGPREVVSRNALRTIDTRCKIDLVGGQP